MLALLVAFVLELSGLLFELWHYWLYSYNGYGNAILNFSS